MHLCVSQYYLASRGVCKVHGDVYMRAPWLGGFGSTGVYAAPTWSLYYLYSVLLIGFSTGRAKLGEFSQIFRMAVHSRHSQLFTGLETFNYIARYIIFTNNKVGSGHLNLATTCATSESSLKGIQIKQTLYRIG